MTAVEWLQKKYWKKLSTTEDLIIFQQAKEMEKQQIINSFNEGWLQCNIYGLPEKSRKHFEDAEQYYNETFNK
jgi:predicted secreted protein